MKPLLLALGLALTLPWSSAVNLAAPLIPDRVKTPGDVLTSDPKIVCVSGYTKTVRNVPQALKEQVYRSYGVTSRESGEYEIDHLISLELGGSNSVRNLWPESYKTIPLNAHVKDSLENKLHALACSGTITLAQAQQVIVGDWRSAYVQYVGALPGGVTRAPVPAVPATPAASAAGGCPASAPIKGNVSSRGKIYHLPGDRYYARTKAEQCFSTSTAAETAGFRASK